MTSPSKRQIQQYRFANAAPSLVLDVDELLLAAVATRQRVGALDRPVDVVGDAVPEQRLRLGALQVVEQGGAVVAKVGHG
jgi:hypothetical protein